MSGHNPGKHRLCRDRHGIVGGENQRGIPSWQMRWALHGSHQLGCTWGRVGVCQAGTGRKGVPVEAVTWTKAENGESYSFTAARHPPSVHLFTLGLFANYGLPKS